MDISLGEYQFLSMCLSVCLQIDNWNLNGRLFLFSISTDGRMTLVILIAVIAICTYGNCSQKRLKSFKTCTESINESFDDCSH